MTYIDDRVPDRDYTIRGDLMFSTVFQNPDLCQGLIETLLSIEIEAVELVTPQGRLQVSPLSRAGIVDVLVRDANGRVFDVEMQNIAQPSMERRARYYGSLMDAVLLGRGDDYRELPDRAVIFICGEDPFGDDLKRYTFASTCRENGRESDDGQLTVYVNVDGTKGPSTPELDSFLAYLRDASSIQSDYVRRVDSIVQVTRDDPAWRRELMLWELKYNEELFYAKKEASEEGRKKGLKEGLKEGRKEQLDALSRLTDALEARGRTEELPRAIKDAAYCEQLLTEFGIGR